MECSSNFANYTDKGVNGDGAVSDNAAASENLIPLGKEIPALVIKQSKIRGPFSSYSSVHFSQFLTLHNKQLDVQCVCLLGAV